MDERNDEKRRGVASALGRAADRVKETFSKDHLRGLFTQRSFKAGGYTAFSCVIVIAIAVAAVMVVEALPTTYTKLDISEDQTTSLSDETLERLAGLDEDITIYRVCEEGEEDDFVTLLLEKYDDASDRVSVVERDPVLHPTFASQYTSDELADNSLVITCGDDYRVIAYGDLYATSSSSYSYDFDGENAVTGAIIALTSEDLPKVYLLTGHGEQSLSTTVSSELESANIETAELNLLSEGSVPEDADAVMAVSPTSDISADEKEVLETYLGQGGHLLLLTDYTKSDMPNLDDLLDGYGVEAEEGVVVEGEPSQRMSGYPYYLLPTIESSEVTDGVAGTGAYVLFPLAHGIAEIDQYRSSLTIEPLLTTSESAYIKTDIEGSETLDQEEGDIAGSTMVGVAVSEEVDDGEARLVWYSTSLFLDSELDARVGGNNVQLLVDSLTWLCDSDAVSSGISSKGTGSSMLTVDSGSASMLSVFFVGVVPLAVLACGVSVWRARRKL